MKTDDVRKALEQCVNGGDSCGGCPLIGCYECRPVLLVHALETIKRQQKELADMQRYVEDIRAEYDTNDTARAEGIREFAERIKSENGNGYLKSWYESADVIVEFDQEKFDNFIDSLVKEMTEEPNENKH